MNKDDYYYYYYYYYDFAVKFKKIEKKLCDCKLQNFL